MPSPRTPGPGPPAPCPHENPASSLLCLPGLQPGPREAPGATASGRTAHGGRTSGCPRSCGRAPEKSGAAGEAAPSLRTQHCEAGSAQRVRAPQMACTPHSLQHMADNGAQTRRRSGTAQNLEFRISKFMSLSYNTAAVRPEASLSPTSSLDFPPFWAVAVTRVVGGAWSSSEHLGRWRCLVPTSPAGHTSPSTAFNGLRRPTHRLSSWSSSRDLASHANKCLIMV